MGAAPEGYGGCWAHELRTSTEQAAVLRADVHDDHLDRGIFGIYTRHYGHPPQPGWVVQIIPSHGYCCYRHANDATTDLSDPSIEFYDA